MFIPSNVLAESTLSSDTYITEYYPLSGTTNHGVVLPLNRNGRVLKVFDDLPARYPFINGAFSQGPSRDRLMSKEEYTQDLNNFVNYIATKNSNRVTIRIKDLDDMYKTYLALHGAMHVAGIVSVTKLDMLAPVTNGFTNITPPEGVNVCLGFDTYTASLKRNLPMLVLDYFTASNLYMNYLTANKFGQDVPREDIGIFLNAVTNKDLSNIVYGLAPNLTFDIIDNTILKRVQNDAVLNDYYTRAQSQYGLRERIAKALLMYHPAMLEYTVKEAMDGLGIVSERPAVWIKPKVSYEEEILQRAKTVSVL